MSTRTDLHGARWSSAVRCPARAEHEALGSPRDEEAQGPLASFFVRGVSAADTWVDNQQRLALEAGKQLIPEKQIPWGPPDFGWTGHADAVIEPDKLVVEAYHSVGGNFRHEKALQAVGYARWLGPDYQAMLAVLDTTEVDEDAGFEVTYYPLDVEELGPEVDAIAEKVVNAVLAGEWNPEDRIADTPAHQECRHCPFRDYCWEGWVAPEPEEVPELDDLFGNLVALQSKRGAIRASLDDLDEEIEQARDEIRPYLPFGRQVSAAGVTIKRIEIAPRRTFKFSAYEGAGHLVTPTMQEFINFSKRGSERWYVEKVG